VPNMFDPQSLNRYAYCRNNPLIYVDPSGHAHYVEIVCDPGTGGPHDVGGNFGRAAATRAAELIASGHTVEIVEVRSVSEFNAAINGNQEITGGVEVYGHAGSDLEALSMASGPGTNLDQETVNEVDWGNLGPNAEISLNGCNTGNKNDANPNNTIAQDVANASGKTTWGATKSMSFTGVKGQYIPGPNAVPPATGDLYMVVDPPGKMERFSPEVHPGGSHRSHDIDNLSGL